MNVYVEPGKRDNSYLYHCGDGYHYHFNNGNSYNEATSNVSHLRCKNHYKRGCPGTVKITVTLAGIEWENKKRHTCVPNRTFHQVQNLRREILQECVNLDIPYETPGEVVRRVRNRFGDDVAAHVSTNRMRAVIRRKRMAMYPAIPVSLYHLGEALSEEQLQYVTRCKDGVDNIFAGSVLGPNGTCSLIFMSRRMRRFMRRCRIVFCDGTFGSRPAAPNCAQVLQIVAVVGNASIPLAQILMTGKTQAEYVAVFEELRRLVPHFRPNLVVTDFEHGLQNAWRQVFNVHVVGCYFHYCRAVIQAARQHGLAQAMRENRALRSLIRSTLAIPLLPRNLMARGTMTLIQEAHRLQLMGQVQPFFDYFIDTWMSPAYLQSLSVFGLRHRTNNVSESCNRLLRSLTGAHRPNLWHFLSALRRYEDDARLQLRRVNMGLPLNRRRKASAINNDRRIRNFTINVMSGTISINRFLHLTSTRVMRLFDNFA